MADHEKFAQSLLSLSRCLGRIARERSRQGEVTPQQAETLQLIAERGALSTSSLAILLGIDPSTASRNLSGLERAGFVTRKKASDDGRQTDVKLTPRGKRAAHAVSTDAAEAYATILDRIPRAERAKVLEGLEALSTAIEGKKTKKPASA